MKVKVVDVRSSPLKADGTQDFMAWFSGDHAGYLTFNSHDGAQFAVGDEIEIIKIPVAVEKTDQTEGDDGHE
jgi:hypothetical protein